MAMPAAHRPQSIGSAVPFEVGGVLRRLVDRAVGVRGIKSRIVASDRTTGDRARKSWSCTPYRRWRLSKPARDVRPPSGP
jgi:hypothetical protein